VEFRLLPRLPQLLISRLREGFTAERILFESIADGRRLVYEGLIGELPYQEVGDVRP